MAGTTPSNLGHLEQLDHKDRLVATSALIENGGLELSGVTLYSYHVIPTILAAGTAKTLSGAQTRARIIWSRFCREARQYWSLKTSELIQGSIVPLHVRTLKKFKGQQSPSYAYEESSDSDSGHDNEDSDSYIHDAKDSDTLSVAGAFAVIDDEIDVLPLPKRIEKRQVHGELDYPNLKSLLDTLDIMPGGLLKLAHLSGIAKSLTPDGRTLFEHHALSRAQPLHDRETPAEMALRTARLWTLVPTNEKKFWRDQTVRIKGGLENGAHEVLNDLRIDENTRQPDIYSKRFTQVLRRICIAQNAAGSEPSIDPASTGVSTSTIDLSIRITVPTPMLDVLCNGPARHGTPADVIVKIRQTVKARFTRYRQAPLQIRHSGVRINYDWRRTDVTSLITRLYDAAQENATVLSAVAGCEDVQSSFESLLRPLLLCEGVFRELHAMYIPGREKAQYSPDVGSCVAWLDQNLSRLRPLDPLKTEQIIATVMTELRVRAEAISPNYELLRNKSELVDMTLVRKQQAQDLLLRDNRQGFAQHLRHCFDEDGLSSDKYEDLLEQKLYMLRCYDARLVPMELGIPATTGQ